MSYRVEPSNARTWSDAQLEALFAEGFPNFITADREVKKYIGRVRECFPQLDVMLVDESDEPVATGWGVPISWSEETDDLPTSFADVLCRSVEIHETLADADTFVICGGVVHPERKGSGVAGELITALCAIGETHGLTRVVAPVRPTRKHLYPQVIAMAPAAQVMTGTVSEWEAWTDLAMPVSGEYVIPQGMSVLRVERDADLGTYVEPNVWLRHR